MGSETREIAEGLNANLNDKGEVVGLDIDRAALTGHARRLSAALLSHERLAMRDAGDDRGTLSRSTRCRGDFAGVWLRRTRPAVEKGTEQWANNPQKTLCKNPSTN